MPATYTPSQLPCVIFAAQPVKSIHITNARNAESNIRYNLDTMYVQHSGLVIRFWVARRLCSISNRFGTESAPCISIHLVSFEA